MTATQIEKALKTICLSCQRNEVWNSGGKVLRGIHCQATFNDTVENWGGGISTRLPWEVCFQDWGGRYPSRGGCSLVGGCYTARNEREGGGPSGHQNTSQESIGTKIGHGRTDCGELYQKNEGNHKDRGHKPQSQSGRKNFEGVTNVAGKAT